MSNNEPRYRVGPFNAFDRLVTHTEVGALGELVLRADHPLGGIFLEELSYDTDVSARQASTPVDHETGEADQADQADSATEAREALARVFN